MDSAVTRSNIHIQFPVMFIVITNSSLLLLSLARLNCSIKFSSISPLNKLHPLIMGFSQAFDLLIATQLHPWSSIVN